MVIINLVQIRKDDMKKILFILLLFFFVFDLEAGVSVVNGLSHIHQASPGGVYKGTVEIKNTGTSLERLKVFINDFQYNCKGQTFYNEPPVHQRSNANWLSLGASNIEILPGETYLLPYQMTVPTDVELLGSFWSVIIVEPADDFDFERARNTIGISTRVRYAVQVISNLGSNPYASVKFTNAEISYENGKKFLAVDLEDTGELYHRIIVSSEFFSKATGESAGVYYSPKQSLHPTNSKRFVIDVSDLTKGGYQAVLLANCEDENYFGINVSIEIDSSNPKKE